MDEQMTRSEHPRSEAIVTFGTPIMMRDGTVLRADVFRPATADPVPVLLVRNPYPPIVARSQLDQFRAVEMGFAVVAQSVRGTSDSEGVFDPWQSEESDGVDTIAWCAAQSWSNGKVAMYGPSYLGHVQLFAAGGATPALAAMSPAVVPSGPYDLTYAGGALLLASSLGWALMQALMQMMRAMASGRYVSADLAEWRETTANHWALCRTTPLRDMPILERWFPAWQQWLDHPRHDDWWHSVDLKDRPAIPTFQTAGWWDIFLRGSLDEFNRPPRHPNSRIAIGPWSHINMSTAHGDVFYGPNAGSGPTDIEGQRLDFLSRYVMPDRPEPEGPIVRIFVMGRNVWRDEAAWPLARARDVRYYLHADGGLSPTVPKSDVEPSRFVFDPHDPVLTLGGRNLVPGSEGGFVTGPHDHRRHDQRNDILRFGTEPLAADLEVTGELRMHLCSATSGADTDWTAMLLDVHPDGRAYNVADGIIRARHHAGTDRDAFIPAGEPHLFEIDLVATSHVFLAGHRIRVDISSSNFPRFDRNPGTGALSTDAAESTFISVQQTVFHDAQRASWITLPVIAS